MKSRPIQSKMVRKIENTPDFIKEKNFKSLDQAKSTAFAYHLSVISIDKENNELFSDLPENTIFTVRDAKGLQVYSTQSEIETEQDLETERRPSPQEPSLLVKKEANRLQAKADQYRTDQKDLFSHTEKITVAMSNPNLFDDLMPDHYKSDPLSAFNKELD